MIGVVAYVILGIVILINIALLVAWFTNFQTYKQRPNLNLKVSVLVAARDEEQNIEECLKSLLRQNYPKHQVEILVGNDHSTDNTPEKVSQFPEVKLVEVGENLGNAKGKANVLVYLTKEATGDIFLITDADVRPNENWIKNMVSYLDKKVGLVNGVTAVKNNLFQHYEWLFAQGMLKIVSDLSKPVAAIGNNMLVTREAYQSTGGYEKIPHSVTEDYALFREIEKRGFKVKQALSEGALAETLPMKGFSNLLYQRKRWMQGAVRLPFWIVAILFFQGIFFSAFLVALFFDPAIALSIFVVKVFLQAILIKSVSDKLGISLKGGLVLFELYNGIMSTFTMLFYLVPVKIKWKQRDY